jgi:hypothetical protein
LYSGHVHRTHTIFYIHNLCWYRQTHELLS